MTDTTHRITQRTAFAGAHRTAGYREDTTPRTVDISAMTHIDEQLAAPELATDIDDASARVELGSLVELPSSIATTGWRGVLAKTGAVIAPSAREKAQLAMAEELRRDETTIRQATWGRAVSILVANPKGGSGKTPVSLLLGGTLAAVRGGSVAIVEVSDDPGALSYRSEGNPPIGLGELVRDASSITTAGQLAGYTAPQTSFASVIGTVGRRSQLVGSDVTRVAHVLDAFYAIRVMDSGNQPSSSAFLGALQSTDALVIPVLNAGDAVLEAVAMIEDLRAAGYSRLADTATIVRLTDGRPEQQQITEHLDRVLEDAHVGAIHEIPYDAHIAERHQLTLGKLSPATYRAFAATAATVIRTLHTTK